MVLDCREDNFSLEKLIAMTPKLCDRRFGIGADGVMALFPRELPETDYTMIYRNADGSDAGMCGNGGRCIAKLAVQLGVAEKHAFSVHGQVYNARVSDCSVQLSFPCEPVVKYELDDTFGIIYVLYTGTEHIVVPTPSETFTNDDLLRSIGRQLRNDKRFGSNGTNVNFLLSDDSELLMLKTYERGVEDLTLACGTGALAAGIATHHSRFFNQGNYTFNVQNPGGNLRVHFDVHTGLYSNIILEGPAEIVFEGIFRD